ncbi:MAG: GGDEF domain-containing protein [Terriglobales bacterium]
MRGLRWVGWAFVAASSQLLLVLLFPNSPPVVVLFLARLALLVAAILLTQAVAEFTTPRASLLSWSAVLVVVFVAAEAVALAVNRNAAELVFLAAFSAQLLTLLLLLLAHNAPGERVACRTTGGLVAATIVLCIWGLLGPVPRGTYMVAYLVLSAGLSFGFIWMVTARLRNQLEEVAHTDTLTGLLNRGALELEAERELAEHRRTQAPLAILAMDLDHFKTLNDAHGHVAGDAALSAAAQLLSQCLRHSDRLARLGGEEFLALLPGSNGERAAIVAERLRSRLEQLRVRYEGEVLALTASFGIAVAQPDDTWTALLRRADVALYDAKHAGRNCVRTAPAVVPPAQERARGVASA